MSFFVHVGCSFWAHLFYRLFLSYRILFTIYAKNGGTVDYIGREDSHGYVRPGSYSINGIIKQSTTFEIEIDFQQPSHCYETQTNCADDALTTRNDFLKQVNIFRLVLRGNFLYISRRVVTLNRTSQLPCIINAENI